MRKLSDYKPKHVAGLYNLAHAEASDGTWLQVPFGQQDIYYRDAAGDIHHFDNVTALLTHWETE